MFLCVQKTKGMETKDAARYLDGVMAVGPNGSQILRYFYSQYRETADQIGVKLDKSGNRTKCQPPDTTVVALGVLFDTKSWTWKMDTEKDTRLLHKINDTLKSSEIDIKQRERIVGKILSCLSQANTDWARSLILEKDPPHTW